MSFLPAEQLSDLLKHQLSKPSRSQEGSARAKTKAGAQTGATPAVEGPIWICPRSNGKARPGFWYEQANLSGAISAALSAADGCDMIEICLTRNFKPVAITDLARAFPNASQGLIGIEIRVDDAIQRIAPITSITTNRNPLAELRAMALRRGETLETLLAKVSIRRFEADQFLLKLGARPSCTAIYRGSKLVRAEDIGPQMLRDTIDGMRQWMFANVSDQGRMTYKYWPSKGAEAKSDNTIRQFMATVALGRLAHRSKDPAEATAASRNLAHNLAKYYDDSTGYGTIIYQGKAKLGAMALAALAILEFRLAGIIEPRAHDDMFKALCAGIEHLWQADGAFRTFLVPADRNDNQNFYPGEALLFWASLHRETRDPALAQRCLQSFAYYRDWHVAQPNPAFVPWHVQAYCMLHEDLGHQALADFALDRSTWLLEMQQWNENRAPDFLGRFYNPAHPEYGPPHASATGVYMEGLIAAWQLARRLQQNELAQRYALALRRGLRALRQLQFRDRDSCAFYLTKPERVMGGLRTEAYNNEIRVDNVQHGLMALLTIEAEPDFPWHD